MASSTLTPRTIASEEIFEADSALCSLLYRHMCYVPPHGAYARLCALTFSAEAREALQVAVSPQLVLQLIKKRVSVDHMRTYPPLYIASDVSIVDVERLVVSNVR